MIGGLVVAVGLSLLGPVSQERPIPTPIGIGASYRLAATGSRVLRALPVGAARCSAAKRRWTSAHVELFANRRVLIIPAGVGMSPPLRRDGAFVTEAKCSYPVR